MCFGMLRVWRLKLLRVESVEASKAHTVYGLETDLDGRFATKLQKPKTVLFYGLALYTCVVDIVPQSPIPPNTAAHGPKSWVERTPGSGCIEVYGWRV